MSQTYPKIIGICPKAHQSSEICNWIGCKQENFLPSPYMHFYCNKLIGELEILNDMSGDILLANVKRLALDCPMPKRVRPVIIPPTTPRCYLSFHAALNLRLPDELTGDWHFLSAFYSPADGPPVEARLAGDGREIDTNPSLG